MEKSKKMNDKQSQKLIEKFESHFIEVIEIIKSSRITAIKSVNTELINLYWKIGEYIHLKIANAEWGDGVVKELASYIQDKYPEMKGYSDKNIWHQRWVSGSPSCYRTRFRDRNRNIPRRNSPADF